MKTYLIITVLAGMFVIPAFGQEPDKGIGTPPGLGAQPSYPPEHPAVDKHWELYWGDDFNYFDSTVWWKSNNFVQDVKNDISVLMGKNVSIDGNGNLVIKAIRDTVVINGNTYYYSSGGIQTCYDYFAHYGYIEARINVPYEWGLHPSFWTWRRDNTASNEAEIDIFEMLGHKPSTTMGTNIHKHYCHNIHNCMSNCGGKPINMQCCPECDHRIYNNQMDVAIPSYAYTWRTFAVEWTPTKLIWYVDRVAVRNFPNPGIVDFVQIILGIGIESWQNHQPNNTTQFPAVMYVDYVKVYKLICGNEVINSSSYNFDSYDNTKLKKSITIGGNGASNTIANGKNVVMRATDFIEIKGEFTASLGASLYLDVNACNNNP